MTFVTKSFGRYLRIKESKNEQATINRFNEKSDQLYEANSKNNQLESIQQSLIPFLQYAMLGGLLFLSTFVSQSLTHDNALVFVLVTLMLFSSMILMEQGGDKFFGEPALDIKDLMRTTRDGRGYMNILVADKLINAPQLYATFLLWLLSELFEELPGMGDPEKPKLVFFFDEAHLLFDDAPPGLLQKIEQTVKLIRSKGIGVYFVTQNPLDVPDSVLSQMGNRVHTRPRLHAAGPEGGARRHHFPRHPEI